MLARFLRRPRKLREYSPEEQAAMPYELLAELRKEACADQLRKMKVPDAVQAWAARMEKRFGPKVYVWRIREVDGRQLDPDLFAFDWPTMLMIVRWGQEPAKWPAFFTDEDVDRALEWEAGVVGLTPFRPMAGVELVRQPV